MNRFESLKPVTRRALRINYVSPNICDVDVAETSTTGCALVSTLEILPVTRAAGTTLSVDPYTTGKLYLSWGEIDNAFVYVVYRSTSPDGPFETLTSRLQAAYYVDTPAAAGTYYYKVTAIEPNYGETEASNIASGTV